MWNKYDNAQVIHTSSFHASGDFYHLQISFANSFNSDQDQKNVSPGPGLDPSRLSDSVFEIFF